MGLYYKVVCDERSESIDPGLIDDFGSKWYSISAPEHPIGPLVMFAVLTRWRAPIRLVHDEDEDYSSQKYVDITDVILQRYREYYGVKCDVGDRSGQDSSGQKTESQGEEAPDRVQ